MRMHRWIAATSVLGLVGCAADALPREAFDDSVTFGTRIHAMPVRDPTASAATGAPPAAVAPPGAHLTYHGGKVVQNASITKVLYGSGTYIPELTSTTGVNMQSAYNQMVTSGVFDWLIEYNTSSPVQSIGRGTVGAPVQIAPAASHNGSTIDDTAIQAELAAQINARALPAPSDNQIYMVHFPAGKTITQDGSSSCVAGGFCAYHGTFKIGTQNVYYGVLPALTGGCATGCGGSPTTFQNQTSVASHELIETITDAEVGLATTIGPPLAWFDSNFGEIGDICNAQQGTFTGSDGNTYTIQQEFSNQASDCILTRPAQLALARLTGDFDGDGKTDIIEPFDNGGGRAGMRVYRSTGTGYTLAFSSDNLGQGSAALAWLTGDVNGDGKTDVIQLFDNAGRLGILVYTSNGTAYTNTFGTGNIGQGSAALKFLTGDVNGDGKTDIIQLFDNGGRLGVLVYTSDGTAYTNTFGTGNIGEGSAALAFLTGDVNGDGKTDIIQPFDNGGVLGLLVYTSNGTGYTTSFGSANMGQSSAALAWLTGDVNGDGKTDIIQPFDNGGRSAFIVYTSNGTGYTTTSVTTNTGEGSGALAWLTGDVNGDGKTDVIQPWNNGGRSGLIVYTSNGVGYTTTFGTANTGEGSAALAWLTGDFNGDHRTDVLQPWANGLFLGMIAYTSTGTGYNVGFASANIGPLD
jgi:hypothetical protein